MGANNFFSLFTYIVTGPIALLILLLIGHIITSIVLPKVAKDNSYKSVFIKLFSGIIAVIFTYSQLKSGFSTVFLLCYPVFIFLIVYHSKIKGNNPLLNLTSFNNISIRSIGIIWMRISILCVAVFSVFVIVLWNSESNSFQVPHNDFIVYSNISNALNITGVENNFYQPFLLRGYPITKVNSLYHYPELWLNSLIIFFTGKASILTFFFITVPVLLTSVIIGILSLYERYAPVNTKVIVAVLLVANLSGIYLPLYEQYPLTDHWVGVLTANFISHPKYCFSAMVFIISVLLLLKDQPVYAMIMALLIPIGNVGHFPGVIGGGVTFALFMFFSRYKMLTGKELAYILLAYTLFTASYYLYATLFCNPLSQRAFASNLVSDILRSDNPAIFIRMYAANVSRMLARGIILYLPFFVALSSIYIFDKSVRRYFEKYSLPLLIFSLLILTFGAFSSFFVSNVTDSNQLFYNNLPVLNISLLLLFLPMLANLNKLTYLSKTVLAIVCVLMIWSLSYNVHSRFENPLTNKYNAYSNDYKSKVIAAVNSTPNRMGVYWLDKKRYLTTNYIYTQFDRPVPFLCLNDSFTDIVEISNSYSFENAYNADTDMDYLLNTPFQRYCRTKDDFKHIHELQCSFIRENKISFGFAENLEAIPEAIRHKCTTILKDSISGEYYIEFDL